MEQWWCDGYKKLYNVM